jgi:hypothetical protein
MKLQDEQKRQTLAQETNRQNHPVERSEQSKIEKMSSERNDLVDRCGW